MHRIVWTLLLALLLQLLAGSAWALRGAQATEHSAHCHDSVVQVTTSSDTHHSAGQTQTGSVQSDSHHCCAVGLGTVVQPVLSSLPQARPASPCGLWASLQLRPDLRPPI